MRIRARLFVISTAFAFAVLEPELGWGPIQLSPWRLWTRRTASSTIWRATSPPEVLRLWSGSTV